MPRPITRRLGIAIAVVACLAGAGCSASGGNDPSSSASDGAKKPLVISLDSAVDLLDPQAWRTPAAMAATTGLVDQLIEQEYQPSSNGLVLAGTEKFSPALAEKVEYSPDGKTATYTLRAGLKFADGTPLTAKDVAWSFQRSLLGPGYVKAFLPFVGVTKADQITAKDDRTFVVSNASVKSPLFEKFVGMQVLGVMSQTAAEAHKTDADPWAASWLRENANSSGAYVVEKYDRNSVLQLKPNPNYYDPAKVRNSGVTMQFITDPSQRALLLRSGQLDLAQGLPPDQLKQLESDANLQVVHDQSNRLAYLGINTKVAPFDNPKVRQAIAAAVPYQALVDQVMKGYARPASGIVPSNMDTYVKAADYTENLDKAKQLLAEAGVTTPITSTIYVRQSNATDQQSAVFIQANLKKIGVEVEVKPLPDAEFTQRSNARQLPMYVLQYLGWGADPFYQMFYLAGTGSGTNFASYGNPALDKLIQDGLAATDAGRAAVSKQAQELLAADMPIVPLYNPDWTFAVRKGVTGLAKDNTEQLRLQYLAKK
ncbi:ABC transporter substrate-binding protein [Dactylosporangium sp. NPDC000521]|uniref:ABC transporter substrate-binding protein n=1 Tax=Dactylosporangium sp. NPDC000521 TaxID=3363975 RepID=UPI0036AEDEAF